MSNKTISMLKLRQVIRLYNQGKGTKAIAGMLFISRNTIKKYLHIFLSSGLSYDAFSAMSDLELSQKFLVATHPEKSQRQIDLEALLPGICRELERKGGHQRDALQTVYREVSRRLRYLPLLWFHPSVFSPASSCHAY